MFLLLLVKLLKRVSYSFLFSLPLVKETISFFWHNKTSNNILLSVYFIWGVGIDIHVNKLLQVFLIRIINIDESSMQLNITEWVFFFFKGCMAKNIMVETLKCSSSPVCFTLGHTVRRHCPSHYQATRLSLANGMTSNGAHHLWTCP